jgi:hypothetical protein
MRESAKTGCIVWQWYHYLWNADRSHEMRFEILPSVTKAERPRVKA